MAGSAGSFAVGTGEGCAGHSTGAGDAFVVWIPAAVFLAPDGSWGKALILALWGGVLVGGIDNVIYPILVGNRLRLHTMPAFMAIVGGLIVFGPSGVILGPMTLTVTVLLLEIWRNRNPEATQP